MNSEPFASSGKGLTVDANILTRAVLGRRVFSLLERYVRRVSLIAPDIAFVELRLHLPEILARRGWAIEDIDRLIAGDALERLPRLVTSIPHDLYAAREEEARRRLRGRDESDWPYLALALTFDCPIWTEDRDFFGSGVATWTTDRVEIYLSESP